MLRALGPLTLARRQTFAAKRRMPVSSGLPALTSVEEPRLAGNA